MSEIGYGAFSNCSNLSNIDMSLVNYIGGYAFSDCKSLTEIMLNLVEYIGSAAFNNCYNLKKVYFYCNAPEFEDGLEGSFTNCSPDLIFYYYEGTTGWDEYVGGQYKLVKFSSMEFILGDVNCDGVVDTADATEILRVVAKLNELVVEPKYADVNYDGQVDTADATKILRVVAKLETL